MSQHQQLARNTLILAIGKAAGSLVSFLLLPVYTIFLTPSDYGFVDLIITYVVLFVPLLTLQMEMSLFRFLVDVRNDEAGKKSVISNAIQIVTITCTIIVGLYVILANILHLPYLWLIMLNVIAAIFSNLLPLKYDISMEIFSSRLTVLPNLDSQILPYFAWQIPFSLAIFFLVRVRGGCLLLST